MHNVPKIILNQFAKIKKQVLCYKWQGCVSTLGHSLGGGSFYHLLVLPDELGQVVRDGDVESRDGAAAEVCARRRQLLELVQGIQSEEVSIRLRIGQVIPVGKANTGIHMLM